jgi:hypothetical protein
MAADHTCHLAKFPCELQPENIATPQRPLNAMGSAIALQM